MSFIPQGREEWKWLIISTVGMGIFLFVHGLKWHLHSSLQGFLPYILFGATIGTLCKLEPLECFYTLRKAFLVIILLEFFWAAVYITPGQVEKDLIGIFIILFYFTALYSTLFCVSGLVGALMKKKYYNKCKLSLNSREWTILILGIYLLFNFLLYYLLNKREMYFFLSKGIYNASCFLLVLLYMILGIFIGILTKFKEKENLYVTLKGSFFAQLFYAFFFLMGMDQVPINESIFILLGISLSAGIGAVIGTKLRRYISSDL